MGGGGDGRGVECPWFFLLVFPFSFLRLCFRFSLEGRGVRWMANGRECFLFKLLFCNALLEGEVCAFGRTTRGKNFLRSIERINEKRTKRPTLATSTLSKKLSSTMPL